MLLVDFGVRAPYGRKLVFIADDNRALGKRERCCPHTCIHLTRLVDDEQVDTAKIVMAPVLFGIQSHPLWNLVFRHHEAWRKGGRMPPIRLHGIWGVTLQITWLQKGIVLIQNDPFRLVVMHGEPELHITNRDVQQLVQIIHRPGPIDPMTTLRHDEAPEGVRHLNRTTLRHAESAKPLQSFDAPQIWSAIPLPA